MKFVTAAIIYQDGKVLLTRRGPNENLAGFWEFPGGKIEKDDTYQECLTREIKEELNLHIEVGEVLTTSTYKYVHGEIHLIALEASILSGTIELTVHDKYEWVVPTDLVLYKLAPADNPIAEQLPELLNGT